MPPNKPDWSELYPEILTTISHKLQTRDDFHNFRTACKNWLSSIPQIPNHLPFLYPNFPHNFSLPFPPPPKYRVGPVKKIVVNSTFIVHPLQNPNPNPNVLPKPWLITLEESNPGKLIIRKPLKRDSIVTPENLRSLDWSKYSVREICRGYTLRGGHVDPDSKVVLLFNPVNESISTDDSYALMLNYTGLLSSVSLKNEDDYRWFTHSMVSRFDDIVNYKGAIWTIDRRGRAYFISYDANPRCLSLKLYAKDCVSNGRLSDRRKRLVESSDGLYLIERYVYVKPESRVRVDVIKFRVYKLDEAARKWSEVKSLDGRILFVTSDCCFFGLVEDFPGLRGDCIVFPKGHFPNYTEIRYIIHRDNNYYFQGADEMLEIGVFCLDDDDGGSISNYHGFSEIFWPPPWWLFSDICPSGRNKLRPVEFPCEHSQKEEASPRPLANTVRGQNLDYSLTSSLQEEATGSGTKSPVVVPVQDSKAGAATGPFPGVDVRPELVPVLRKIWDKHGDITEHSTVMAPETCGQALESLAEAVLILKTTPWRSFNESQAGILRTTLADLQLKKFRVDWLAPLVEKALACLKNLPLVDELVSLKKTKASIEEMRRQLPEMERITDARIESVEGEINKDLGQIDLESFIGEGLC